MNAGAGVFERSTVRLTQEFTRVANLPRRQWADEQASACADYYTSILKTPYGTQKLRPLQAISLHEARQMGGLFGPQRVGAGKTLFSFLAPALDPQPRRPVLLLPASLIKKTRKEMESYIHHWRIPRHIEIQSYETLGRVSAEHWLDQVNPDLIIADEAHKLKNLKAACTRRVKRWMDSHPQTRFIAISGTLDKDGLEDYAHLLAWCLKSYAPVPLQWGEVEEWSSCIDVQKNPMRQMDPGPLLTLAAPEDHTQDITVMARLAFKRRLRDSYGVVCSNDTGVGASLYLKANVYQPNRATEDNFLKLRTMWETPDSWPLSQAVDIWRHARELALGFHYVWDPRPPMDWLEARKQWAKCVRDILSHSKTLDSELMVRNAVLAGHFPEALHCLREWQRLEPSFYPNQRAIWHDDTALNICAKWAAEGPGIIWTQHSEFARELGRRTGLVYYGQEGMSDDGQSILDASPKACIVASIGANSAGLNLQGWCRNLYPSPPTSALTWEQSLGRTHRDGQEADTVTVDVLMGCREHYDAIVRALERARASEQTMGHTQKLLLADLDIPTDSDVREWSRVSMRWDKSIGNGREEDE